MLVYEQLDSQIHYDSNSYFWLLPLTLIRRMTQWRAQKWQVGLTTKYALYYTLFDHFENRISGMHNSRMRYNMRIRIIYFGQVGKHTTMTLTETNINRVPFANNIKSTLTMADKKMSLESTIHGSWISWKVEERSRNTNYKKKFYIFV